MHLNKLKVGLRTLKTAIAIMLCILLFQIIGGNHAEMSMMIASLSAAFAMRQDISSALQFGKSRIISNILGGALALVYYFIISSTNRVNLGQLILIPFFVIILIVISNAINNQSGIIGGISALLIVSLTVSPEQTFIYPLLRIADTLVGTFISIAVNYFIKQTKPEEINEIDNAIKSLEKKELELEELKQQISAMQKKENHAN